MLGLLTCGRCEDALGVLTLFGEVAQVFHDDRVELSEELEEEEQEGIKTEEDNKRSTKHGHGDGME